MAKDFSNCKFDLVLVIDESGSMTENNHYQIADLLLRKFISKIPVDARIAVVDFNSRSETLLNFSDQQTLQNELDRLVRETGHSGQTDISTGVNSAVSLINGRSDTSRKPFIATLSDVLRFTEQGRSYPDLKNRVDFSIAIGQTKITDYGSKYKTKLATASDTEAEQIVEKIFSIMCPEPKEVPVSFKTVVLPKAANDSSLEPCKIILDGVEIGQGTAEVNLLQGSNHTVIYKKPSHPDYIFNDGTPPSANFTIPQNSSGETYTSTFTGTRIPGGYLTVTTTYDPPLTDKNLVGEIYLDGNKPQNLALPADPDATPYLIGTGETAKLRLDPGTYTISFRDIEVPNMSYKTPPPFKITIKAGDDLTEERVYIGSYNPSIYWLKPVDDIDFKKVKMRTVTGLFSNNVENLITYFISGSSTDLADDHYVHIYDNALTAVTSSIQFSIAYGHIEGSGSNDQGGQYNDTATRAIYSQYRNIILETSNRNGRFNLTGDETDHFYALSYQRARRDEKLDYDALEINIAHLSGSEYIAGASMQTHTGSNVTLGGQGAILRLISDSSTTTEPYYGTAGLEYNLVSGSIEDGVYSLTSPKYYGKIYPSLGVVLIDADKLDASASFGTVTSREIEGGNNLKMFTAISGAASYTDTSGDYLGMKARAWKDEIINYYFFNVRNKEFNYSNNPTFVTGSDEVLEHFQKSPQVYATTIGLYDVDRNLVAVAKVSQAEKKTFTDEVIYNIKLKF